MTMGLRAADGTWIQRLGGGDNPLAMMGNVKPMYMNGHENGSLLHIGGFSSSFLSVGGID